MANGTDTRSRREQFGEQLQAFGAGLTGQGPQFQAQLAARREQEAARRDKDLERMANERRDAAITDAFGVKRALELGTSEGNQQAVDLLGNRIQGIGLLGGDPGDTVPIFEKAQSGDFKGALRDVNNVLELAEAMGFIKLPKPEQDPTIVREMRAFGIDPKSKEGKNLFLQIKTKPGVKVSIGDAGFKVPTGFRLADPDDPTKGVTPIPANRSGRMDMTSGSVMTINRS